MQIKVIPHPTPKVQASELETFVRGFKEQTGDISLENISSICVMLMKRIQLFKELNGPEKKQVVIWCLYKLVEEVVDNEDLFAEYDIVISTAISSMIDIIIDFDKNKVRIYNSFHFIRKMFKSIQRSCCMKM